MFCPKCGNELADVTRFCNKCGAPIGNGQISFMANVPKSEPVGKKSLEKQTDKPLKAGRHGTIWAVIAVIICCLTAGIGSAFIMFRHGIIGGKDTTNDIINEPTYSSDEKQDIESTDVEGDAGKEMVSEDILAEDLTSSEDTRMFYDENDMHSIDYDSNKGDALDAEEESLLAEFGIDPNTIEDFSKNLEPNEYLYYDSGIGEFSFFYPAHMFCNVEVDDSDSKKDYGQNIKTITFYGSEGTKLSYAIYKRTDGRSLDDATNTVHDFEHEIYYDLTDILVKTDADKGGRFVAAGVMDRDGEYRIYDLIKISDEYVYKMLSIHPQYYSEEERLQYAYVTENEYRMCGFSGSSKRARSYEEYLREGD